MSSQKRRPGHKKRSSGGGKPPRRERPSRDEDKSRGKRGPVSKKRGEGYPKKTDSFRGQKVKSRRSPVDQSKKPFRKSERRDDQVMYVQRSARSLESKIPEPGDRKGAIDRLRRSMSGDKREELKKEGSYRINRYLAAAGYGSRRQVEKYILEGRVRVGSKVVEALDTKVKPGEMVFLDDRPVNLPESALYYVMNKPAGYTVTAKGSPFAEHTIYELLPENLQSLKYAGRLDRESRGVLILSNDGDFLNHVAHPSVRLLKKYIVTVSKLPAETELQTKFIRGVEDGGELLRALRVSVLDRNKKKVEVVLGQGRNRQIRRMFRAMGIRVIDLFRTAVGGFDLNRIPVDEGKFISVDPGEILYGIKGKDLDEKEVLKDFDPWKKK